MECYVYFEDYAYLECKMKVKKENRKLKPEIQNESYDQMNYKYFAKFIINKTSFITWNVIIR